MKKRIGIIIVAITLLIFPANVLAADTEQSTPSIISLEDGSYFTVVIEDENTSSNITLYSTSVTKSKTYTYYNSKGTKQWYVKVTGTFTYGNGTSKCNSSSVSAKSYVNAWKITSKSSSKSGKTAIAKSTAKQYYNGTVINTINETVKLTCSSTGKFS